MEDLRQFQHAILHGGCVSHDVCYVERRGNMLWVGTMVGESGEVVEGSSGVLTLACSDGLAGRLP